MKKKRKSKRKPLDLPTTPIRTDQRLDEHQKEQMLNAVMEFVKGLPTGRKKLVFE